MCWEEKIKCLFFGQGLLLSTLEATTECLLKGIPENLREMLLIQSNGLLKIELLVVFYL